MIYDLCTYFVYHRRPCQYTSEEEQDEIWKQKVIMLPVRFYVLSFGFSRANFLLTLSYEEKMESRVTIFALLLLSFAFGQHYGSNRQGSDLYVHSVYYCKNGIPLSSLSDVCDGKEDCPDASDEQYCSKDGFRHCYQGNGHN